LLYRIENGDLRLACTGTYSDLPRLFNSTDRPANPLSLSPIPPPPSPQSLAQVPKFKARLGDGSLKLHHVENSRDPRGAFLENAGWQ
jgi:hypothetical protein